jgi:hypothetical protein
MITSDNIGSVFNALSEQDVINTMDSNHDYVILEAYVTNSGWFSTLSSADFDEDEQNEVLARGGVYCDKDDLLQLFKSSDSVNKFLLKYLTFKQWIMSTRREKMTDEIFKKIYTDKDFRNRCAGAYKCCDKGGNLLYMATCDYPVSYIVTDEQIQEAKALLEKQKSETLAKYSSPEFDNVLVLRCMGMDFDPATVNDHDEKTDRNLRLSDIGNYRVRGRFSTEKGYFFVEYMTDRFGCLYCDFSIKYSNSGFNTEKQYNYGNIERGRGAEDRPFTKDEILREVNRTFDANFKSIVLERHDLMCDEICSRSVKSEK